MSIASDIQRIKNNIANAYTAILEKGGVLPSNKNSSNLANTINSISSSAKYGITVVTQARIPSINQFGCPTIKNKMLYSNN